jgi:ATP-binding cassette subfamily B protein
VITIAHRLSTIADADMIVVLEAGQMREQGTHDELLALNGRYTAMWERQSAEDTQPSAPLDFAKAEEAKRKLFSARNSDGGWNNYMPSIPG